MKGKAIEATDGNDLAHSAIVVTSVASPNRVMHQIAEDSCRIGARFYVVGDTTSPSEFALDGCSFLSIEAQMSLDLATPSLCPTRHYARKNVGYLAAIRDGGKFIVETDDDNLPRPAFYRPLPLRTELPLLHGAGWVNIYRYFTKALIWPRGLPLDAIQDPLPPLGETVSVQIPIQQGLADGNPDVDAIYRLLLPLPIEFDAQHRVALGRGCWCPFNSQNTVFYPPAYPLMYLPAHCSFRMTDIWRSFVAQRIAWANGWSIAFREATVVQERNDHNLMRDFADEISGYLGNRDISKQLESLDLPPGTEHIGQNMRRCYKALVDGSYVRAEELQLLDAWLSDLDAVGHRE